MVHMNKQVKSYKIAFHNFRVQASSVAMGFRLLLLFQLLVSHLGFLLVGKKLLTARKKLGENYKNTV